MLRLILLFAVLFPLVGAAPSLHADHATLTEVRYNAAKKQLELSVKVFTDDFEKAISQGQPAHVSLTESGPRPLALASAYVQRTLQISTPAGAPLPLQVLGMQAENDGHWLYCKVSLPGPMPGVKMRHAMMLDVFGDEVNIVNIEAGSKKQSALFRAGQEQQVLTW
jgi:hypothetical protein